MWFNQVKTAALLAALSGLLMLVGALLGGMNGLILFFFISLAMNGFAYFYSDKIVLKSYNAKPLSKQEYGWIYDMVAELTIKVACLCQHCGSSIPQWRMHLRRGAILLMHRLR